MWVGAATCHTGVTAACKASQCPIGFIVALGLLNGYQLVAIKPGFVDCLGFLNGYQLVAIKPIGGH